MTSNDADANVWHALVDGVVVGTGTTADEALAAARQAGHARPALTFVENDRQRPLPLSPVLDKLRPLLDHLPQPVYLVGGTVRDALLAVDSHDIDLVVPEGAIALTFALGNRLNAPAYILDEERDVGRVMLPQWGTTVDIARFRGPTLEDDLFGRDFSVNALALPVTARHAGSIIDLTQGLADLREKRVRVVRDSAISDDPIRALRAVRVANTPGFSMTPETAEAVRAGAPGLTAVSPERIRDELVKLAAGDHFDRAVLAMRDLSLLPFVVPEVAHLAGVEQSPPHHEPVLEHTISVLRWLQEVEAAIAADSQAADPLAAQLQALLGPYRDDLTAHLQRSVEGGLNGRTLLRLGALFHDVGKRGTQTFDPDGRIRFFGHDALGATLAARRLRALAFSNETADSVATIADAHMRPLLLASAPETPSRRATYRFFRATRDKGVDVILLSLADHLATYDGPGDVEAWPDLLAVCEALLATYFTAFNDVVRPVRLLTGGDLIRELGLAPGPEVGRLLSEIEEAQAAGQVTTRDEAIVLARTLHSTGH